MSSSAPTGREVLLAEIAEQPSVIASLLERQQGAVREVAEAYGREGCEAIVLAGRGSSDHAAVYGRYLFEIRNRALTSLAAPSTVTLYGSGPRLGKALVIGVSQSGQGEDVVAYLASARAQGAFTVAVVNDPDSPLAKTAHLVLDCQAGPELSVPATKTVTAQMTLLAMLSSALPCEGADDASLGALPAAVADALGKAAEASELATQLAVADAASIVGRGLAYPVALELALKLKETVRLRAEPFSAADFLHGPVTLVGPGHPVLLIDVGGHSTAPALDGIARVRARGGTPLLLRAAPAVAAVRKVPTLALAADLSEWHAAIAALVLGQRLAVELARVRGMDPSRPPGLTKVTSTR